MKCEGIFHWQSTKYVLFKERESAFQRESEQSVCKCLAMLPFTHSRVDRLRNKPSAVPLETARGNSQTGLGTKSNQSHTHADATSIES